MNVKIFDLKKSFSHYKGLKNYYVAEYHNVKSIIQVNMFIEFLLEDNSKIKYRTDLYGIEIEA